MTWEEIESLDGDIKTTEDGLYNAQEVVRWFQDNLSILRKEKRDAERAYIKSMGVEWEYDQRDPPLYPSEFRVFIDGERRGGSYYEWCQLVDAVRAGEVAGHLPHSSSS